MTGILVHSVASEEVRGSSRVGSFVSSPVVFLANGGCVFVSHTGVEKALELDRMII